MNYAILKYIKSIGYKLFWFSITIISAFVVYAFYHPETEIFGFTFINPFYEFIDRFPFWVYIIFCFIIFSILCVIVFNSTSLILGIQNKRVTSLRAKYYKFFSYILSNYLLSEKFKKEEFRNHLFKKIKPFLKTRIQILSLFESYLKLQETLTVNLSDDFKIFMSALNIQKKIESFIYHDGLDDRILAMKMLSYLRIHTCDQQILKNAQSKIYTLRTEAYASLIRLMETDEHLVKFIGEKHDLSLLDINIIVNAVIKNNKMNIDYRAMLSSNNPGKIMVGLILAKFRYRKNKNNLALILNHLGNPNPLYNRLAWDSLLTLVPEDDAVDIIIDYFENEPEDVKLLILKKSRNILNKRFYSFLREIIEHQPLLVKIEALRIIFQNDFDMLSTFKNSQNEEVIMAYNEVSSIFIYE